MLRILDVARKLTLRTDESAIARCQMGDKQNMESRLPFTQSALEIFAIKSVNRHESWVTKMLVTTVSNLGSQRLSESDDETT